MKLPRLDSDKRYAVLAKRHPSDRQWTLWTQTNTIEFARVFARRIKSLGYYSGIVDTWTKEMIEEDK